MGGLEWDLFSSKFYLTVTEGRKTKEKRQVVKQREGGRQGSAEGGEAFPAEMSKS